MNSGIQALILFAAAFVPSVLGSLSGIGGGIIIKPVLDAVSPFSVRGINFLSGCTVLSMSCVSLARSRRARPDDRRGGVLAAGTVFGGAAGKLLFSLAVSGVSDKFTGAVQSAILTGLAVLVQVYMFKKEAIVPRDVKNMPLCFSLGLVLGIQSSFLGIGGGPVNIMVISYFLGMDSKTTGIYSIYAIFLSQLTSLTITLVSGTVPAIPLPALAVMIAGGIGGGLLGSRILRRIGNRQVDLLFRYILAAVILLSAYNLAKFWFF